jgi:hypothetical protein
MQKKSGQKKAKAERRDITYGTLEAFSGFFEGFTPPAAGFDRRGAWTNTYAVYLFAGDPGPVGFLEIERRPATAGVELVVATRLAHYNGYQEQKATLRCAGEPPGALRSARIESVSGGTDGAPVASTRLVVEATVSGGAVEFMRAGRRRTAKAAPPVVAGWALFDVVQQLSAEAAPLQFTLLDDGDLLKPAQRLLYAGRTAVRAAGGASLALDCWEQTGYGVLPTHYWVDGRGQLLAAIAGQKAFFCDPEARRNPGGARRGRAGRKA